MTTHTWSAQDYRSYDQLPLVGGLLPGSDRVLVATGYDKWGLALAVAASLALSARVLGGNMPWARAIASWRSNALTGLGQAARVGADVPARLAGDWLRPRVHSSSVAPPEGRGRVELDGQLPTAVSTVGGRTRNLCAVCPQLGGIVAWNDAEHTWDCPSTAPASRRTAPFSRDPPPTTAPTHSRPTSTTGSGPDGGVDRTAPAGVTKRRSRLRPRPRRSRRRAR